MINIIFDLYFSDFAPYRLHFSLRYRATFSCATYAFFKRRCSCDTYHGGGAGRQARRASDDDAAHSIPSDMICARGRCSPSSSLDAAIYSCGALVYQIPHQIDARAALLRRLRLAIRRDLFQQTIDGRPRRRAHITAPIAQAAVLPSPALMARMSADARPAQNFTRTISPAGGALRWLDFGTHSWRRQILFTFFFFIVCAYAKVLIGCRLACAAIGERAYYPH